MPGFFRKLLRSLSPDVVKPEQVESDEEQRCPKLASLTKPLDYYIALYERSIPPVDGLPTDVKPGDPDLKWYVRQVSNAYHNRVVATWGMIAKGTASVPYALTMLKSKNPDIREDGAGVLMGIGKQPAVMEALLAALDHEMESQPRDVIISALGKMKDKRAIPALARIIRQPDVDGDTRWCAIESLGDIVRKQLTSTPNPVEAALRWLDSHGH
jgi:hypothetical protein